MSELGGHGGAGGVRARYDDLTLSGQVMDDQADLLRENGSLARGLMVDGSIAEAALLCPAEVAAVEAALTSASTLPGSATWLGVELEALGKVLRLAVATYTEADERLSQLEELGYDALGLAGGAGLGLTALTNPLALLALGGAAYLGREELLQLVHDDPWLQEMLTRSAPGLVQGTALSLLGPLALLDSGGHWPTTDYEDAVLGLQTFGQGLGYLNDNGDFDFTPATTRGPLDLSSDPMQKLITSEWANAYGDKSPHLVVIPVTKDGVTSYVVQIPGTEDWSPRRGDNPYDLTSNVSLMTQAEQTRIEREVASVVSGLDGQVMLVGHSQGGIIAAAVASDPAVSDKVHSMVTMGAPIARYDVPEHVNVLSIENSHDVVPRLDGQDNPDRPSWTTITHDDSSTDLDGAHGQAEYTDAGRMLDQGRISGDVGESWRAWQADNEQFFAPTGDITVYDAVPGPAR